MCRLGAGSGFCSLCPGAVPSSLLAKQAGGGLRPVPAGGSVRGGILPLCWEGIIDQPCALPKWGQTRKPPF